MSRSSIHFSNEIRGFVFPRAFPAVFQVSPHVEMPEQTGLLKNEPQGTQVGGDKLGPILPRLITHPEVSILMAVQTGYGP